MSQRQDLLSLSLPPLGTLQHTQVLSIDCRPVAVQEGIFLTQEELHQSRVPLYRRAMHLDIWLLKGGKMGTIDCREMNRRCLLPCRALNNLQSPKQKRIKKQYPYFTL